LSTGKEEVSFYDYDPVGRLLHATYAMTMDGSNPPIATSRAITRYDYNEIGQLDKVANYWQTLANLVCPPEMKTP